MVLYTFLSIKVFLPEFVSFLGEIWVLCVRNGLNEYVQYNVWGPQVR